MAVLTFSSPTCLLCPLRHSKFSNHSLLSHNRSFTSLPTAIPVVASSTFRALSEDSKIRCVSKEQASPVPGFDPKAGVSVYKPKSYEVLVTDAAKSLAFALQDGKTRLEIDFPYFFFSLFLKMLLVQFCVTFSSVPCLLFFPYG